MTRRKDAASAEPRTAMSQGSDLGEAPAIDVEELLPESEPIEAPRPGSRKQRKVDTDPRPRKKATCIVIDQETGEPTEVPDPNAAEDDAEEAMDAPETIDAMDAMDAPDSMDAPVRKVRKKATSRKRPTAQDCKPCIDVSGDTDDVNLDAEPEPEPVPSRPGKDKKAQERKGSCIVVDEATGEATEEDAPDEEELDAARDDAFLEDDADAETVDVLSEASDGEPEPGKASRMERLPSTRDSFQVYVSEVSRFPLLDPEEEHELAVHYRDHQDAHSAFRLVSSHLRLVVKIALDFQRRWMQNVLDLVQEGNVGLMHALNKFDPDKGIKFSYYASFWIKAYILKFIMDNFRMVKIGTTQVQRKLFFNLNRERQKLIAQGFNPDAEILSRSLGVNREDVEEMDRRLASADVSLNLPVGDEQGSATRMDFLPALGPGIEDSIASNEISYMLRTRLESLLPELSEKEQYILKHRLLSDSPETLREIGDRYGVTRERVRQLEIRLLAKIKQHLSLDIKDFSEEWITP